ncbi:hypothetical protein G5I_12682 [Acromyrmex echinatior]|uniref:Uncharacterized protein n=1 Tax=Acromyrmex echinatior TaxID=103372 RepID=F4X2Z7_ACREC|nr:hypothetical protein G5I_12682 [Acromyrmex echinatior]
MQRVSRQGLAGLPHLISPRIHHHVLGTSLGTAGKSGKESPRGGETSPSVRTVVGDGTRTNASFALEEELLARYEEAKVTADKP